MIFRQDNNALEKEQKIGLNSNETTFCFLMPQKKVIHTDNHVTSQD